MGQKRKASKARIGNLQAARGTLSDKRRKSTPADSDREEGRLSEDEIVHFRSF
jgi:hypothetical protein